MVPSTMWGASRGQLPFWLLSVALTSDQRRVVGSTFGETCVWDAADGQLLQRLPGANRLALVPAVDDASETQVVLVRDGVSLHALDGSGPVLELEQGGGGSEPLAVSPDGRWLAARAEAAVSVWELSTGRLAHRLEPPFEARDDVSGLAFLGNTTLLVARDYDAYATPHEQIERWSLDGNKPRPVAIETGPLFYDAFIAAAADGSRFVVKARFDADLRLFGGDGLPLATLSTHDNADSYAAVFSPDGACLALVKHTSISLWRARDGERLGIVADLPTHTRRAVAFARDGCALVVDDVERYRFVDVETGRFACAAAGIRGLRGDAQSLAEDLALSETHEADYRTAATGSAELQPDGAWLFDVHEGAFTAVARIRDRDGGAVHLELSAHASDTAGDWANEHHVFAADVDWARQLLELGDAAQLQVRRGARRLALEVTLACVPPPATVRGWMNAVATRCQGLG